MKLLTTCGAIILNESGQLLVLRRSDTDKHRPLQWDLPGGHAEPGESFDVAIRREVLEETGLDLSGSDMQLVFGTSGTYPGVGVTWLIFLARTTADEIKLSYEHDDSRWVSLDDAINMIEYPPKHEALVHVRDNGLLDG
jgi:8-oxo-dGTP diphosphatase